MVKRSRLPIMVAVWCGVVLVVTGVASAAVGVGSDDPPPTTSSTQTTLAPASPEQSDPPDEGAPFPTTSSLVDPAQAPDAEQDDEQDDGEETFGRIISALREAGDHTPAAVIMGKDVPGWDPEKHPGSTTDTTAYPPGQRDEDSPGDGNGNSAHAPGKNK